MFAPDDMVFYRNYKWHYPKIVRGKGVYVYDEHGKEYLDACSGSACANLGHGSEEIAETMAKQARTIAFTHLSRFTTDPIIELAQKTVEFASGNYKGVYFVSGGSEATETAIKLARQYYLERDKVSNKYKIISRWRSYHGNTIGALSLTGKSGLRRKFEPLLLDFPHIEPPYCYRCSFGDTYPGCGVKCAFELEKMIIRVGSENIAGFIAEPVIGSSAPGAYPPPEYFQIIRDICNRHDILMIMDEVMSGFGRAGKNFAMDYWGIIPDVVCLAKGISCGYAPLGATMVTERVLHVFQKGTGKFVHGHTYGGNPLACAVGAKVLEILVRDRVVENSSLQGEYLLKRLQGLAAKCGIVGDVRGLGLFLGIEFVLDKGSKKPFPKEKGVGLLVTRLGLENGLVLYPDTGGVWGDQGDHILLTPPLNITRAEVDLLVGRLEKTLLLAEKELADI